MRIAQRVENGVQRMRIRPAPHDQRR